MAKATTSKATKSNFAKNKSTILDQLNANLEKNEIIYFWGILISGIILALMSFNARMSEAHDDSAYIEAGFRIVDEFPNFYYTANAPLYPMFLALITLILGANFIYFKLFSILFYVLGAIIFYKTLNNKVAPVIKFFVFIYICLNYLILYFASQTFSESFYMFIQSVFFYYFTTYNFSNNPIGTNLKSDWKKWIVIGFLLMVLTLAKNILVFGVFAVVLFYIIKKDWKKAIFSIGFFGIFKILYEFIKNLIWGKSAIQYANQVNILMNKDPYDASQGQEDLSGFIVRFFENISIYLGKRFYQLIGFFDENFLFKKVIQKDGETYEVVNNTIYFFLAIIVLVMTFYGLYKAYKNKQDFIFFFILFSGTICFGTFFVLQTRWDQPRLLMVHLPSIFLGIAYGLSLFFEKNNFNQRIFIGLIALVSISFLLSSSKRAISNLPIVLKNIKGDIYYGYTPDWKNYLQMSVYCKDSLPETSFVAARKASMSFVYAKGKHFYPIYSVIAKDPESNQSNPDSALAIFKKHKVTHVLLGSLRINPAQNTGEVINTIHNIIAPIAQKYPEKLRLIKEIGLSETAYLYEIKY
ncbi:MAG: ArnT family glycosyltransferase [Bacteroidota bacterium]